MNHQISLSAAKSLINKWSKGTFPTISEAIRYHFARHGKNVSANNIWQYLRKAEHFSQNLRGARKSQLSDEKIRYMKKGVFVIKDLQNKIVSFGQES